MSISPAEQLKRWIEDSRRIVFFGGAGISTESRIPDFRSETGLYQTKNQGAHPPEVMLSRSFFYAHPEEFYAFYKTKMLYPDARPNRAHRALAELEKRGRLTSVITQNIDGLHQMAGSEHVLELHGSVYRNSCVSCGAKYVLSDILDSVAIVPVCTVCGGIIKPEVVLYEENLDSDVLSEAMEEIQSSDMLIVGGTSLTVNPAAGLVRYYRGEKLVLLNKTETPYDRYAGLVIRDSIGLVLGDAVFGAGVDR
ncbi:NAD-dependent protein deacylase [Gorillibacterium sp. sgz5001074]|uniref:NAD-dependent protein deacylase n=1 Tax=Gorillibacterium sp. sgz5001074 TaxID=3446695 RepID=UPI003F67829B